MSSAAHVVHSSHVARRLGTLCLTTSAHSRTLDLSNRAWKLGCFPGTSVPSALETFATIALYKLTCTIPYHTISTKLLTSTPVIRALDKKDYWLITDRQKYLHITQSTRQTAAVSDTSEIQVYRNGFLVLILSHFCAEIPVSVSIPNPAHSHSHRVFESNSCSLPWNFPHPSPNEDL